MISLLPLQSFQFVQGLRNSLALNFYCFSLLLSVIYLFYYFSMSRDDYSTMKAKSLKFKRRYDPIKEQREKALIPFRHMKRIIACAIDSGRMRGIIFLFLVCGMNTLCWMMIVSCVMSTSLIIYLKSAWLLKQRHDSKSKNDHKSPQLNEENIVDNLNYYLGADITLVQEGLKRFCRMDSSLKDSKMSKLSLTVIASTCTGCVSLLKQLFQKEHGPIMNNFTSIEIILLEQHTLDNSNINEKVQDNIKEKQNIEQQLAKQTPSMNIHCTFVTTVKELTSQLKSQKMDVTLILLEALRPLLNHDNDLQLLLTESRNISKLGVVTGDYERSSLIHCISQDPALCSAFRISEWKQWLEQAKLISSQDSSRQPLTAHDQDDEGSFAIVWTFGRLTTVVHRPEASSKSIPEQ